MNESDILGQISHLENVITECYQEIKRLEEDIEELTELKTKIIRFNDEMGDAAYDSKSRILRLANIVNAEFLDVPSSILTGSSFSSAQSGLDHSANSAGRKIQEFEERIQSLRQKIAECQSQISDLQAQLHALQMQQEAEANADQTSNNY